MFKLGPPGIITITIVALIVRIFLASWSGLATDEANGVMIAVSGSWSDMLLHLKNDGNAPLFYALIRLLDHEFGHSDFAVKSIAVAIATAFVPFCYFVFRAILPKSICLQLAWILAFCPSLIRYGTLVRPYAMVSMLGLLSSFYCIKILTRDSSKLWIAPYGISTALLVYTHYWGAFVPIGQACLAAIGFVRKWFGKQELKNWLFGVAFSLLLFAPQVPTLIYQLQHDMSPWDTIRRPIALVSSFLPGVILDIGSRITFIDQLSTLLCNLIVIVVFASTARFVYAKVTEEKADPEEELIDFKPEEVEPKDYSSLSQNFKSESSSELEVEKLDSKSDLKDIEYREGQDFDSSKWKTLVVCGLAACFIVNFILPSMRFRYILPFVPMIIVVYLVTLKVVLAKRSKFIRYVAPCLVWILLSLPQLQVLAMMPETNTGKITEIITRRANREKDLVVISWQIIAPAIIYYLPKDVECVAYPDLKRSDFNHWPEMNERVRAGGKLARLKKKMNSILESGGAIWLVERARDIGEAKLDKDVISEDMAFEASFTKRMNQIHQWLKLNAKQSGEIMMAPGRDFPTFLTKFVNKQAEEPEAKALEKKIDKKVEPKEIEASSDKEQSKAKP